MRAVRVRDRESGNPTTVQARSVINACGPFVDRVRQLDDPAATPLLARRTAGAGLMEKLFALQILGDDRAIARTYVAGHCGWRRAA